MIADLQKYFQTGQTKSGQFRAQMLARLETLVLENEDLICQALFEDLHKPKQEALMSEVAIVLEEIRLARKNLKTWMQPKKVSSPIMLLPAKSRIYSEPLGVVLIIGPWNYPFQLALAPLVGAIAAGNCAVIKPSEHAPATSKIIATLVEKYFPKDYIRVVEGGVPETTALLNTKFDHIFFTGSTQVGKIVMQAAAKNLVPVTLELGGKSPVIVTESSDLDLAARRIVWGKFYNAGQTCVAPDYLYVQKSVAAVSIEKIKGQIRQQFGENPEASESYGRIINDRNFQRLLQMLDQKKIASGGKTIQAEKYIEPTVLKDITWEDPVMKEEIFGPILPVLTFESYTDVINTIASKEKPLSAYLFSNSVAEQKIFIDDLAFGGGCINDVVVHLGNANLPFGGVGESGMGNYHGANSFQTFSHAKAVMHRTGVLDLSARYAPYSLSKLGFLRKLIRI